VLRSRTSHSSDYQNSRARVSLLGKAIEWVYLFNTMLFLMTKAGPSRVFARAMPYLPQSARPRTASGPRH
jgi:hypothetical protein